MSDKDNNTDFEDNFSETIDGFANLFDEVEMDDVANIGGLSLSTQPAGKYSVVGKVDEGGMKEILEIEDTDTTRTLAMAIIKSKTKSDDKNRSAERFVYEARITALLQHPNIVPVHDIGINENGEPYFTMKLIQGENLKKILNKLAEKDPAYLKKYPLSELLTIFTKTCEAIAYAHSKDVIHLDMKPDNIQVSDYGEVLIVDWGLAKILHDPFDDEYILNEVINSVDLTLDGFIKGTPGFMAPEQAMGKNQEKTKLTDIYSLGAILYNILTLKKPYEDEQIEELCKNTIQGNLIHPHNRAPDRNIPKALEAVCLKAMAVKPENRYQDVEALISDINAYTSGFSTEAEDASLLKELKLLISRHKSIAALVFLGFFLSIVFVIKLQKNQILVLNTVSKLETEKKERLKISQLAAPKIFTEVKDFAYSLEFAKALKAAELCTELDSDYDEAWVELGKLHFLHQSFEKSKEAFEKSKLNIAQKYLEIVHTYGKSFASLNESEILSLIKSLHAIDREDYITIGLFTYINTSDKPITEKISLAGKALESLNPGDHYFNFTTHFDDNGKLLLNMRGSWPIKNIKPLIYLPIRAIHLNDTSVQDIRILKTMPLETANLSFTPIKNIDSLKDSPIKVLSIRGSRVFHMNQLKYLGKLEQLEIDENPSTVLDALVSLSTTKKLSINNETIDALRHKYRTKLLQLREN
ncbi:MAG: serine/threonine protein kinase [Lentisphaeraceae bacterium]|nr:serine/threonine protein kinase [Lentisphaeraceae bacterium]